MQPTSTAPACADTPITDRSEKSVRRGRRAAAAIATTVGATAIATTTLAVPAQAASSTAVWDRVANCESSKHWHINTGNGFYGGLQFSSGTWRAYHGKKYAGQANQATRAEQIEVARRVLAAQGPGAWPVCGPRAGLTRHSGHATHAALPKVAGKATPAKRTTSSAKKAHKPAAKKTSTHHKTYKVHSGDTLTKIAHKLHVHGGWKALYKANRSHLSSPNVLHVGRILTLP
jgi:resuscitation-promoting factor RpfA